ncbi:MAG: cell envelope integrity protein CreD [Chitinophagaceae bacterium]|nr:cell envelope integrity protein CreD [Chitinophagaceae bacterium]
MNTAHSESFWSQNKLTIKGILVAFLILAMLIPTLFILALVEERAQRKNEVVRETTAKWASSQAISGPLLIIPYNEMSRTLEGNEKPVKKLAYFLPEHLTVNGKINPEKKSRTVYDVIVYRSLMNVEGNFAPLSGELPGIDPASMLLNEARICIGISDFRGIEDQLALEWNGARTIFNTGIPENDVLKEGLSTIVAISQEALGSPISFKLTIELKGSESLGFTPVGKTTNIQLSSAWPNPSFDGSFLPTGSTVTDEGFTANWKIQHLNRSYPQSWKDMKYDIKESTVETKLLQPVDSYAQTKRSIKYAVLFIALTFALYFFVEITQKKKVHPIQYVLVGMALCIFYTLLLSISEYLGFNIAYAIAASATIMLITLYTKSLFTKWKVALLFGSLLALLYGFIFVLIQLQDNALLFGSIGLFVVLAIIMYYSRKIDWYGTGQKEISTAI